jgi:hypothetical protein
MEMIIQICGGAIATVLLSAILKGISNINSKIEKILLANQDHETIIETFKIQFADLWKKNTEIDQHLQSTDKNISALQERTKNM